MRQPYSYTYPSGLHKEITRAMNAHQTTSTDISREDWEVKNDPRYSGGRFNHFHVLIICIICGIALLAILLTVIFADLIDSIKPEIQLVILMAAALTFGILRLIVWLRNLS